MRSVKKCLRVLSSLVMMLLIVMYTNVPALAAEISSDEEIILDFDEEYEAQFEKDFYNVGGDWAVEDGVLKQKNATAGSWNMTVNYRQRIFGDFTAFIRFRITEENAGEGWFGFFFRRDKVTDTHIESGYGVTVNGINGSPPGKTVMIDWTVNKVFADEAVEARGDGWNEMAIMVKGNTYYYFINDDIQKGIVTMSVVDDAHLNEGYIGIGAGNCRLELDYLKIYSGTKQEGLIKIADGEVEQTVDPMLLIAQTAILPAADPKVFDIVAYCIGIIAVVYLCITAGYLLKKKGDRGQ